MRMLRSIRTIFILAALLFIPASNAAQVSVGVVVNFAPPELPVYEQPLCPGDGYIWTPGYWGWDGDDYYWVPGTWVLAPEVGFLWTPGYWGWGGSGFVFHEGFWGPQVGFYGGINYGYGYSGHGYEGGRWDHDHFYYNRSVNNVNVTQIHNVYNTTVVNNTTNVTRVSYNGGNGGVSARASSQEEAAARERHIAATSAQNLQVQEARSTPQLKASANRGKPPIAATPKSGAFNDRAAVPAREGGRYMPPAENHEAAPNNHEAAANNNGARPAPAKVVHPKDIPPSERPAAPNTGNVKQDQKYQQQQEKLYKQQEQSRQNLQKQQDAEHQKLQKQQANEAKQQQTEQKHQQQTQKLMQKQAQQQQHMQSHQAPPQSHPAPNKPPEPHQN